MASARKKVSKTSDKTTTGKTTTKAAKKETTMKDGGAKRGVIEEKLRVELPGGRFIDFRITIASAPKVGPGPRPRFEEMLLIRRLSEDQVLTISAELARHPTAAIKVGPGKPPGSGN